MSKPATGCAKPPPADLDEVYRTHVDSVWRLARLLGVAHDHLDDLVHDVFLTAHRRLDHFDPDRSMKSWLGGITRNLVLHYRRDHARRTKRLALVPPPPQQTVSPDESVARTEAAASLERFVGQLNHARREVFVLFEVEGLSAKAIAEVTGTNINTVFTRLRAARKKFERFVAAQRGDNP